MKPHSRILQLDVQGSFDFYTCIVSLDAVDQAVFHNLRNILLNSPSPWDLDQFYGAESILPLVAHELTHFIDATSTTWGFRHLSYLQSAFGAMRGNNENEFHHLKTLHDHLSRIRLPNYYSLQGPARHAKRPWRYRVTVGRPFNSRGEVSNSTSISFCRFENSDGDIIVRSPLSTVSLLECTAMAQEILMRFRILDRLEGNDKLIELQEKTRQTLAYLYNRETTEYSVCAHLVANHQQSSDIIVSFLIAGSLARWVLNFPLLGFNKAAEQAPIGRMHGISEDHPYAVALRDGLKGRDLGALFYLLSYILPKGIHERNLTDLILKLPADIESAARSLGLDITELDQLRSIEINANLRQLTQGPSRILQRISIAGANNLNQASNFLHQINFNNLDLPQVYFKDLTAGTTWGAQGCSLANLNPNECFDELHPLERFVRNFVEACI